MPSCSSCCAPGAVEMASYSKTATFTGSHAGAEARLDAGAEARLSGTCTGLFDLLTSTQVATLLTGPDLVVGVVGSVSRRAA